MTPDIDPSPQTSSPDSDNSPRSASFRAIGVGIAVVAAINLWMAYCEYVVRASRLNGSHFPVALVAVLFVLVVGVVPLLGVLRFLRGFSKGELIVISLLGLVGAAIPANGLTGFLLGVLATPYYYATPENRWGEFHPFIPSWLVPPDLGHAMRDFFNGLAPSKAIPWELWIPPLFWWATFVAAIISVCLGVTVLLRRQWVEHERLAYPLVEAGLDLAMCTKSVDGHQPIIRRPLFWIGLAIPFFILTWNAFAWLSPTIPNIDYSLGWIDIGKYVPSVNLKINFLTTGFSYFAPKEALASLLVFYALHLLEASLVNRLGIELGRAGDSWTNDDVIAGWQSWGAFVVFVLWGLWMARFHLKLMWRAAWRGQDHTDELCSPRTAFLIFLVGSVYMWFWLGQIGMERLLATLYVGALIIGWIGMGRMVAEAGYLYQRLPVSPQTAAIYPLGAESLSLGSLTSFAFTYTIIANGRGIFAPALFQVGKLADMVKRDSRRILWAIIAAFAVGITVSVIYTIYLGYTHGAYNFRVYPFSGGNREAFGHTIRKLLHPFPVSVGRLVIMGIGGALMTVLMYLRYRFPAFPLHPIGFAVPATYLTRHAVSSMLIAWAAKTIILAIGGRALYQRSKPFFVGMIAGYGMGVAASFVVDAIWFPGSGHTIHSW